MGQVKQYEISETKIKSTTKNSQKYHTKKRETSKKKLYFEKQIYGCVKLNKIKYKSRKTCKFNQNKAVQT
jgi:hypothetical protein